MKILGRNIFLSELPGRISGFVLACVRIFFLFKHPFLILKHYIMMTSPVSRVIELHDGLKFFLSAHKHDLTTVVIVVCKKDYGDVPHDGIVIDIGANIGAYSLYAAYMGAQKVYAFEPNRQTYKCLLKNVNKNALQSVIKPFHLAVTAQSSEMVQIPQRSSPYNRIQLGDEHNAGKYELVPVITLADIIRENEIVHVDLLKMDCEGEEYGIISATSDEILVKIDSIRMEYHRGPLVDLIAHLEACGFELVRHKREQAHSGILWFSRRR